MATGKRKIVSQEYNNDPVISGNKKVWFLNVMVIKAI